MGYTTLNLGLSLTIPTQGTRGWASKLLSTTWTKISNHQHTGSGDGAQMVTGSYSNDSVTGAKIRLAHAEYLRARNSGNNANVNLLRLNGSDVEIAPKTKLLAGCDITGDLNISANVDVGGDLSVDGGFSAGGAISSVLQELAPDDDFDIDLSLGNVIKIDLAGISGPSVEITALNNPQEGAEYTLLIKQHPSTLVTVSWPGSVIWEWDTPPVLDQDGVQGKVLKARLNYDGTNFYGD